MTPVAGALLMNLAVEAANAGIVAGGVVAGVGALAWAWKHWRLALLPLFTRLARPRLLEQPVRARIHELVEAEPGIYHSAIARRLDLAEGQALYHLSVLVREKLLSRMDAPGHRHYFPHGKYSPATMRAMAALRQPAYQRLFAALQATPGMDVGECAAVLGLSGPRISKLARRMEAAGLLRREPEGRRIRLYPLNPTGIVAAPTFSAYAKLPEGPPATVVTIGERRA